MVLIPIGNHDCIVIQPKAKPTPTPTPTTTVTRTPTPSVTTSVTAQPTNTPTNTKTPTPTNTKTSSQTPTTTNTRTATNTPTKTPTNTPTTTITTTPTNSLSNTITATPTRSNTPTRTMRPTPTPQFCKLIDIPDSFTANVIGYGQLNGQQEQNVLFTRSGNTWSGSGTFPCGASYTLSMTCDPVLRKYVYDGTLSCGSGKSVIDPTDQPLILPNQDLPAIVTYSNVSDCPPPCIDDCDILVGTSYVSGFPSGPNGVNWFGGNEGTFKSVDGVTATFYDPVTGGQNRWGQVVYKWTGGIVAGKSYEIKFTANLSLNNVWGPMYFAIGGPMLYLDWAVDKALLSHNGVFNNNRQWLQRGDPATPFPLAINPPWPYSYATTGGVPWTVKINGSGVAKLTNSITTGTWTFSIPQNIDLYVGFGNALVDTSQNSSVSNFSIIRQD